MQDRQKRMKPRTIYLVCVALGCLVAGLSIDFLYFPHSTVFPDEQRFLASAIRLAQTGEFWVGADRAWDMPGTAMFFAVGAHVFGPEAAVPAIRVAQSLLVVLQSALIGLTARRLSGDRRIAMVAATLAAFYPFFLFYQGLLLSETLFNTFLIAGVASLYWWRERGLRLDIAMLATCACFAAAAMTKATLTVLPPLLLATAALQHPRGARQALRILVVASLAYALLLSPWWIRNHLVFGSFVPFATGSGANLYLGNNPANPHAGISWQTDVEPEVVARVNAIADERARQREYVDLAVDYIVRDPAAFLDRLGKKFIRFWNPVPNADAFNRGIYAVISAATFGPVLVFAIVGTARWRRRLGLLAPIYLLIGYFTIVHIVTIASLRYRLPLEPLLILLAAGPITQAIGLLSTVVRRLAWRTLEVARAVAPPASEILRD